MKKKIYFHIKTRRIFFQGYHKKKRQILHQLDYFFLRKLISKRPGTQSQKGDKSVSLCQKISYASDITKEHVSTIFEVKCLRKKILSC